MSRIDDLVAAARPAGMENKTLGEVFNMRAGNAIRASEISPEPKDEFRVPCYGGNGVRGYVREASHSGLHLLVGRQGALCGNVKRADGQFYATEHAVVLTPRIEVDLNWAFHLLLKMDLNRHATKSAQPGLAVRTLERVPMPVPPLAIQRQIASVLDKMALLKAELEAELEAELDLRSRQYAFYRDALLNFPDSLSLSLRASGGRS